jgi:hypothetical protein
MRGVVHAGGAPTRFGDAWSAEVRREPELRPAAPWPARIDVDDYYANLPESVRDLFAAWKDERQVHPAMLD